MTDEQRPVAFTPPRATYMSNLNTSNTDLSLHYEEQSSPLNNSQENIKPPNYQSPRSFPGYAPSINRLNNSYDETSLRHTEQLHMNTSQDNVLHNYPVFNAGQHGYNSHHPEMYPGNMSSGYPINQQTRNFPLPNNFSNQPQYHFYPHTPNVPHAPNVTNYDDNYPEQRHSPRQAWHPDGHDSNSITQSGQRKSLDETLNRDRLTMNVGFGTVPSTFQRQHRRGRSDEAGMLMSINPNYNYEPRFHSPPPMRAGHMSQSTTSLENIGYSNPSARLPHSMSMDTPALYNSFVHERLYAQSAAYVNLTTAIKHAQRKLEEVEGEVEGKENELNELLSVQKNPTEKEHNQMKDEVSILHREIEHMCQECDRLGISIDPSHDEKPAYRQYMQPPVTPVQTPSPTNPTNTPDTSFQRAQPFASMPPYANVPPHNKNVRPKTPNNNVITNQPPPYEAIKDPVPPYRSYTPDSMRPPPRLVDPNRPPPLPPRPFNIAPQLKTSCIAPLSNTASNECMNDNDEYWVCTQCTFKNLLVAECEVCFTPRPPHAQ